MKMFFSRKQIICLALFFCCIIPLVSASRINMGSIAGKLFHDLNYNGVFDTGEPPLDFEVTITGPDTLSMFPDPNGEYNFQNLPEGSYSVSINIPQSWTIMNVDYTGKINLTLGVDQQSLDNDFAVFNLVRPTDGAEQMNIHGYNLNQGYIASPQSRLYHSCFITASAAGFNPDTLYVRKNQIVPMYISSIDGMTHVFMFNDASLSQYAIGVGPNETRALYWKAYNVTPGQSYPFHCDVPGHTARGERGVFVILSSEYPEIVLSNPINGETIEIGSQYTVNWTSSGHGDISVQLSVNNGQTWMPLNNQTLDANSGSFSFVVPDNISDQCKLRVIDADYQHIYAVSEGLFSIAPHSLLPEISTNPQQLHFPNVILTNTTPSVALTIKNMGYNDLVVSNWSITSHADWFNVTFPQIGVGLGHLETATLEINCTPQTTGTFSSELLIYSNASAFPILSIPLSGFCEYIPPLAPQNIQLTLDDPDMLITWNAVTQDIYGNPVSPTYYFVYGSNVIDPSSENLVFLGYSRNTSFRHQGVNLPGANTVPPSEMFYRVVAVLWFPREAELTRLDDMKGKASMQELVQTFGFTTQP